MQWIAIVCLSVLMSVFYGILHDQITARICVEYFTVGHPPIFPTADPTLLGIGWGILATWWVGVLLGVPLATAARLGAWPKRSAESLIRPMLILLLGNGLFALLAGLIGYVAASHGWVQLSGSLAQSLPPAKHTPFLVDGFAHVASYGGGFLGGLILIFWVIWTRRKITPT
jgi:hypothetical protein